MNAPTYLSTPSRSIRVTMVGTGGGIASPGQRQWRNGPAVVVQGAGVSMLFDTGRNVLQGMHKLGIEPASITHLAFTHYHSDHTIGLPELVLSTWVATGRSRWRVIGPPGGGVLVEGLFGANGAFRRDIEARAYGESSRRLFEQRLGAALEPPDFDLLEVDQAGQVASGPGWSLEASTAPDHVQTALMSLAYRFATSEGSVVITGDTGPTEDIADFARGAELLIHDCTLLDRSGVYQNSGVHTDPESLGRIAVEAEVKAVVGTHVPSGRDRQEVLERFPSLVARSFKGPFTMAGDGLQVDIVAREVSFAQPASGGEAIDAEGERK